MDVIPWYLTVTRLVIPTFILRWPLWGLLASTVADMYDWKFVNMIDNKGVIVYQSWDKGMDFYYWLFILWVVRSWKDNWARRVAVGLFLYRMVGMVLFWVTNWRPLLVIFPNVFENFVIWCLVLFMFAKRKKLGLNSLQKTIMLLALVIPKLIHEYFMHFLIRQPWELYDVGKWLGFSGVVQEYVNYFVWGGLLYIVPLVGFLMLYRKTHRALF